VARRHIQLRTGSTRPKSWALWENANQKLAAAETALDRMATAPDRVTAEAAWSEFVDALEQFWTRFFDEGKARFTKFQPWAGEIDKQRRIDPLLNYLIHSRHLSQHGRLSLQWSKDTLLIAPDFYGCIRGFGIFQDGTYEIEGESNQPGGEQPSIVYAPGEAILPAIDNNRAGLIPSPTEHLGMRTENSSPVELGALALRYYSNILSMAQKKFAST
jgi:hypothetical protein